MRFAITFVSSPNYLFITESSYIGTDKLTEARKQLGVNVPIEIVKSPIEHYYSKAEEIQVSEVLAFKSEAFSSKCYIRVEVKGDKPFNPFIDLVTVVERDKSTDAILNVSFKYELNEDKVLEAWEAAGFPAEWDLSAE